MIQASSAGFNAGDSAEIIVNDVKVEFQPNEQNHYRGLHVAQLDPTNGKVIMARVFDTHSTSQGLEAFIKTVPVGHIVVAACKDECASNLSQTARQWFVSMGSQEISRLQYREGFVFIGTNGIKEYREMRSSSNYVAKTSQVRS